MSNEVIACRFCRRYAGIHTFHTTRFWTDVMGEDDRPQRHPSCRVTTHSEQGVKTYSIYRASAVKGGKAEQPCEPQLSFLGRLARFVGVSVWLSEDE